MQFRARRARTAAWRSGSNKLKQNYEQMSESTLRRVLEMDPTEARAYVGLGKLLLTQLRIDEARKVYDDGAAVTGMLVLSGEVRIKQCTEGLQLILHCSMHMQVAWLVDAQTDAVRRDMTLHAASVSSYSTCPVWRVHHAAMHRRTAARHALLHACTSCMACRCTH